MRNASDASSKAERERLAQEFLLRMRDGFELGGGDYPKREEIYAERLERLEHPAGDTKFLE